MSSTDKTWPLIDAAALHASRSARDVILDASWYLPSEKRSTRDDFHASRIAGARRFDFDGVVTDRSSDLPHMMPPRAEFQSHVRRCGINDESRVVIYDTAGIFAAPRAWWMFKAMGHADVVVLDGGLDAWIAAGYPLESGADLPPFRGNFTARPDRSRIAGTDDVLAAVRAANPQIVDARSAGRFEGRDPEPRPGLRTGHMPGARNLPFGQLLADGRYRPVDELRAAFSAAGVDLARPVIATCGSGVTACIVALAAEQAGIAEVAVYDGSWADWGRDGFPELLVETGSLDFEEGVFHRLK